MFTGHNNVTKSKQTSTYKEQVDVMLLLKTRRHAASYLIWN